LQGHVVHVVGVGEGWTRELPGLADARYLRKQEQENKVADTDEAAQDRMKIAWRYERLGQAGERGACGYGCVWVASDSSRYQNTLSHQLMIFLSFQISIQLTGK
jgi:hypothetical protein